MIDAYVDGELDRPERERLEAHLTSCPHCRDELAIVQREMSALRAALAAPEPPPGFTARVLNSAVHPPAAIGVSWPRAVAAGVTGNLVTAALLVLLSLGTRASFVLMVTAAIIGSLLWGSVKGLAFRGLLRFMPPGVVTRGLAFGAGIWLVTNLALLASGGFSSSSLSPSVVLIGSLVHHLLYGVLLSILYERLPSGMPRLRETA